MSGIGSALMRAAMVALMALPLSACITPYPDLTQSRSPCRMEPGGWCDFVRDAAVEAYPYGMLSTNAYLDDDFYAALPMGFVAREAAENADSGLAYSVFDRYAVEAGERGAMQARVIAFRGTDSGSSADFFYGSLGDSQRDGARAVYTAERAALDAQGDVAIPIELTGHSLGGALATQISIDNPGVRSVVFNTSPFFTGDPGMNDQNRMAITERGEFLRALRRLKAPPAADAFIVNCNPSASTSEKHNIRDLTDCLIWIAAYTKPDAQRLLNADDRPVRKPEVECGPPDKVHPAISGVPSFPCPHAPVQSN
ncbi:MAG: hypothetical protein WA908_09495 [Pontixanthobacter sp.]